MESNNVFIVSSDEEFLAFKRDLSSFKVKSAQANNTKEFLLIDTPDGRISLSYYNSGTLVIQGNPQTRGLKDISDIASKHFIFKEQKRDDEAIIDLTSLDKKHFIGLDESGVGETFGSLFLGIAATSKENLLAASKIIKPRDTKTFDIEVVPAQYTAIKRFFTTNVKRITAREVDAFNKIELLDSGYIELMETHFKDILDQSCIILDDYGIGSELEAFFKEHKAKGANIILSHHADSTYLPPMAASLIARKSRKTEISTLSREYSLIDPVTKTLIPVTAGATSNPLTKQWLLTFRKINPHADFPSFVRKKWKNVQEIEKEVPKREISYEFSCRSCTKKLSKIFIKYNRITNITELLCPDCSAPIDREYFRSNFKRTSIILDTSILISRIISKDLTTTKYLEGIKFIIPSCVYEEIDTKQPDKKRGAEKEVQFLKDREAERLIELSAFDVDYMIDLPNDKKIIYAAKQNNAAIMTKDRTQNIWSNIDNFVFQVVEN